MNISSILSSTSKIQFLTFFLPLFLWAAITFLFLRESVRTCVRACAHIQGKCDGDSRVLSSVSRQEIPHFFLAFSFRLNLTAGWMGSFCSSSSVALRVAACYEQKKTTTYCFSSDLAPLFFGFIPTFDRDLNPKISGIHGWLLVKRSQRTNKAIVVLGTYKSSDVLLGTLSSYSQ